MRPWARTSDYLIATRVLAGQFPAPRAANPGVSAALEEIILKATSFDRRERHATAAELQLEIEAHLHSLGGRLPQRDLGELVAKRFAGERTVIAAVIAEQLELCAAAHSDAELPAQLALLPTLAGIAPLDSGIVDVASLAAADDEDAEASASPAALPARADATQGRGRVRLLTAATAVLAAAVVVASMSFVFGRASAPPARIVEPAPTVATASSAAAEPRPTVDLELSALPLHAHFVLDETPLVGNPYRGALPRDGAEHRLRTEATGFVPRVQSVLLDRDRGIEIVLAAEPGGTHGRHAGSADPPEERPHPSDGPPHAPPTIKW
jgi:serine/threonine-protein kinase